MYIRYILFFLLALTAAHTFAEENDCVERPIRIGLVMGFDVEEPYQFFKPQLQRDETIGIDAEIIRSIQKATSISVTSQRMPWQNILPAIQHGDLDFTMGLSYSDKRAQFLRFSAPYRYEENAMFVLQRHKKIRFGDIDEYLSQMRFYQFKLGVIQNVVYADATLNNFINDNLNASMLAFYGDENSLLQALLDKTIDGAIMDRTVGSFIVIKNDLGHLIREISLGIKAPVHIAFNKNTVSEALVNKVNAYINTFIDSAEYRNIIQKYTYPLLLLQIIHSDAFYYMMLLGAIFFGISAIVARYESPDVVRTIFFGLLPSCAIFAMQYCILPQHNFTMYRIYHCILMVIIILLPCFATTYVLSSINRDRFGIAHFLKKIFWVTEATAESALASAGMLLSLLLDSGSIILWCPLCAFFAAHGTQILRDSLWDSDKQDAHEWNASLSVMWGLIFGMLLSHKMRTFQDVDIETLGMWLMVMNLISRGCILYFVARRQK